MKEIITVKEYNRRGREEYRKAVNEWKQQIGHNLKPFPFLPMFLMVDDNQEEYRSGYTVVGNHRVRYFQSLKDATEYSSLTD